MRGLEHSEDVEFRLLEDGPDTETGEGPVVLEANTNGTIPHGLGRRPLLRIVSWPTSILTDLITIITVTKTWSKEIIASQVSTSNE